VKAISLWQPWASLCFTGWKQFETRHWSTFYRGPLAIHAAKRPCDEADGDFLELLVQSFGDDWRSKLPRGAVIGTVRLSECLSTEAFDADAPERLCGDWYPGRFAWRFEDQKLFDAPIPALGRQGFFEWDTPAGPLLEIMQANEAVPA